MKTGTTITSLDKAILIVGDPGTRKTTLALHFPSPYFLDCDGNLGAPVERTGITAFKYDSAMRDDDDNPVHPIDRYLHCIKCINAAFSDPSIKTIIIDSLTAFYQIVLAEVARQEFGTGAASELAKDAANFKTLRQQDWGKFAKLIDNFFTKLRGCGKLLVVTAHNNVDKDEATGIWKTFLNIPGASKQTLSGKFTDCWNTYIQITGLGATATHSWMVRSFPTSENDHRGVKSSFMGFDKPLPHSEVIKLIQKL